MLYFKQMTIFFGIETLTLSDLLIGVMIGFI